MDIAPFGRHEHLHSWHWVSTNGSDRVSSIVIRCHVTFAYNSAHHLHEHFHRCSLHGRWAVYRDRISGYASLRPCKRIPILVVTLQTQRLSHTTAPAAYSDCFLDNDFGPLVATLVIHC